MAYEWPIDRTCLPALPAEDDEGYDDALAAQNAAEDLAVQVLWSLSGRQFGVEGVIARPCPTPSTVPWRQTGRPVDPYLPIYFGGRWTNYPCGCVFTCQPAGPRTVHLPGPVDSINSVTIDGVEIDSSEYTLEGDVLYRIGDTWPSQDLNKPMGETGTWSVDYGRGISPPSGVGVFVGQLAKEFLAACSGESCRLPRNVVAVTSRGVSKQFDPSRIYAAGKTGLPEVDMWLSAVNPRHIMKAPAVR